MTIGVGGGWIISEAQQQPHNDQQLKHTSAHDKQPDTKPHADVKGHILNPPEQQQYQNNDKNYANDSAGSISPTGRVRPCRHGSDQNQNEDNDEDRSEHDCILSSMPRDGEDEHRDCGKSRQTSE